jgi:hypothetical protein
MKIAGSAIVLVLSLAGCCAAVNGELRTAEWRQAEHGRQNRQASARECARRLALSAAQ